MTVNFFDNFNLFEFSWSMTSCSQFLNFHQWWNKMKMSLTILLNVIFSCSSNIIKIKIIFWWLVKNLAKFLSKSIFRSTSQLLYWAIMLLYISLNIFDKLILMFLWSNKSTEQSELLFSLMKIIKIFLKVFSLEMLSYFSSCRESLQSFISYWNSTWSAARIILMIK